MDGAGQLSLHVPLSLKWRQAWGERKENNRIQAYSKFRIKYPNTTVKGNTHQTVGVFGAGAACSTLHMAAVARTGTFTALTAWGAAPVCHCEHTDIRESNSGNVTRSFRVETRRALKERRRLARTTVYSAETGKALYVSGDISQEHRCSSTLAMFCHS